MVWCLKAPLERRCPDLAGADQTEPGRAWGKALVLLPAGVHTSRHLAALPKYNGMFLMCSLNFRCFGRPPKL